MNSSVADLIAEVIRKEGGYVNNPNDSGGETVYGITVRTARQNNYHGPMVSMPKTVAEDIYEKEYWYDPGFYDVSLISKAVARELFDTGINCSTERACEFLQIALNGFNRQGKDYSDIAEDFDIGPATLHALRAFIAKRQARGEVVMLRALNSLQGAFYLNLGRRRPKDEDFMFGWFDNRVEI